MVSTSKSYRLTVSLFPSVTGAGHDYDVPERGSAEAFTEEYTGIGKLHLRDCVSHLNVSRPSLHRELRKLEEAGIITYAPPVITIIDTDPLQNVLSK